MWNDMRKVQKLIDNAQLNHKQFVSQVHDLTHLCHSEESVVISDSRVEAELCDAASFMKMKSLKTVSGTGMTLVFCKWVAVPERCQLFKNYSTTFTGSSLQPPDVPRLAETARISLTPTESVSEFWLQDSFCLEETTPKILQVIDWWLEHSGWLHHQIQVLHHQTQVLHH